MCVTFNSKKMKRKVFDLFHFTVLLVDVKEKDDLLPWQPKTVNGELFIVYLLRIWLGHWAHEFEQKSSLQQLTDELQLLKQGRQKVKEFHEVR